MDTKNKEAKTADISNENNVEIINTNHKKKIDYKLPKVVKYRDPTEQELIAFNNICNAISRNKTVHQACEEVKQLSYAQFNRIVATKHPEALELYARACEEREVNKFNLIEQIANDTSNDFYMNDKGVLVPNPVAVQRARLQIDTLFRELSIMNNKKFGKLTTKNVEGTVTVQQVTGMVIT